MHESREVLGVVGERAESEKLLREFIKDTSAPEDCSGRVP